MMRVKRLSLDQEQTEEEECNRERSEFNNEKASWKMRNG